MTLFLREAHLSLGLEQILQQVALKKLIVRNYEAEQRAERNEAASAEDQGAVHDSLIGSGGNVSNPGQDVKIHLPFKGIFVR